MTGAHEPDPLLVVLAGLASPPPAAARDARIQARCHAAMTRRGLSWPRVFRPAPRSTVDALLAAAAGLYGVVLAAEAIKAALRF